MRDVSQRKCNPAIASWPSIKGTFTLPMAGAGGKPGHWGGHVAEQHRRVGLSNEGISREVPHGDNIGQEHTPQAGIVDSAFVGEVAERHVPGMCWVPWQSAATPHPRAQTGGAKGLRGAGPRSVTDAVYAVKVHADL